jgi:hypothetical protein
MSEIKIKRRLRSVSVTLATALSSCETIRMDDMAGGVISMGTVSTNASTLQIYGSDDASATFRRVYGADGSAADITLAPSTVVGTIYALPDAAFALPLAKIVSGDTNSTGVSAVVALKS